MSLFRVLTQGTHGVPPTLALLANLAVALYATPCHAVAHPGEVLAV